MPCANRALIYNHITARIPGTEHLLINLYGLLYKESTASGLVKIDVEGNIVSRPDKVNYRLCRACRIACHTRCGVAGISM